MIIIIIMKVRNFQLRILTIEEFNYVEYSVLCACEILLSSFLFNLCFQRGQFLKQKYLFSFTEHEPVYPYIRHKRLRTSSSVTVYSTRLLVSVHDNYFIYICTSQ